MQPYLVISIAIFAASCGNAPAAQVSSPAEAAPDKSPTRSKKVEARSEAELAAEVNVARVRIERLHSARDTWSLTSDEPCPESIDELRKYTQFDESQDPWGRRFVIACPVEYPFAVLSKGPDGKLNTADDISSEDDYDLTDNDRKVAEAAASGPPIKNVIFCGQNLSNDHSTLICGEVDNLEVLQEFLHLESVELSSEKLKNVAALSKLSDLRKLSLSYSGVEDLSPLADLVELRELNISNTGVEDLSPLSDLVQLRKLEFSSSLVTDLSSLQALVNLRELKFTTTRVRELGPLATLTSLEHLSLSFNGNLRELGPLASLGNLRYLNLAFTQVSDLRPVAAMNQLRTLHLIGTQVTDLSPLAKLTNLRELSVQDTIADSEIAKLRAALPALEISVSPTRNRQIRYRQPAP